MKAIQDFTLGNGYTGYPRCITAILLSMGGPKYFPAVEQHRNMGRHRFQPDLYPECDKPGSGSRAAQPLFPSCRKSRNPNSVATHRNRIMAMHSRGDECYIGTDAFLLKLQGTQPPVFRSLFPIRI